MENAKAYPTKEFFVRMITKDISLEDCILDLIDNCLDGARRTSEAVDGGQPYDGFQATLRLSPEEFTIADNCGGISISNAIDYAFRFGRDSNAPEEGRFSVGLYGIGMKRAVFKIGKMIEIGSSTEEEAFLCTIPVDEWLEKKPWEFDMTDAPVKGSGTVIRIRDLYQGISQEFADPAFVNGLVRIVARDYARFIGKGFNVAINGGTVKGDRYDVRVSEEFQPYRHTYKDDGVQVDILAGMAAPPANDNDPVERAERESFGWFVFCNDRVVLAADKTERTVWGDEQFSRWHPQYNGFMGMVLFRGSDPKLLPWTTTKRDVDDSSPLYRRAVNKMKTATQPWIDYTHQRRADLAEAKIKEQKASPESVFDIKPNSTLKVPTIQANPRIQMAFINYQKPRAEVKKAATALGNSNLTYKGVGERTFEYFMENEVEGEQ